MSKTKVVKKASNGFLRTKIRKASNEMAMNSVKKAIKNDKEKPRMYLLPTTALTPIAAVLTYGAKPPKYSEFNYKMDGGLDWDRVYSACLRHLLAWNAGEDIDPESKLPHLSHAGAGIVMLLDLVNSNIGKDTRFKV